tara:strand:+ start:478 stop:672 length:195 start_codon:yes stop_codon:yes gene_type:complete
MKNLSLFIGKIRPQIFLALCLLGIIAILGIWHGLNEVTVGCIAGVIALAKDVLQVDSGNGEGEE